MSGGFSVVSKDGETEMRLRVISHSEFTATEVAAILCQAWTPDEPELSRNAAEKLIYQTAREYGKNFWHCFKEAEWSDEERGLRADWAAVQTAEIWPGLDDRLLRRFVDRYVPTESGDDLGGAE